MGAAVGPAMVIGSGVAILSWVLKAMGVLRACALSELDFAYPWLVLGSCLVISPPSLLLLLEGLFKALL